MPIRMDEVSVTTDDVTASMRNDNLKRVDKFIQTASKHEAAKIRGWAEHRLLALGAIKPTRKIRKRDRVLSRLAVETVPILWSAVSGLAFLAIILAYHSVRQLMIRARR